MGPESQADLCSPLSCDPSSPCKCKNLMHLQMALHLPKWLLISSCVTPDTIRKDLEGLPDPSAQLTPRISGPKVTSSQPPKLMLKFRVFFKPGLGQITRNRKCWHATCLPKKESFQQHYPSTGSIIVQASALQPSLFLDGVLHTQHHQVWVDGDCELGRSCGAFSVCFFLSAQLWDTSHKRLYKNKLWKVQGQ